MDFNAAILEKINRLPPRERAKAMQRVYDKNGNRQRKIRELSQANNKGAFETAEGSKIRKEYEEVVQHNEKLLERGLNPNNENDRKHFKKLDNVDYGAYAKACVEKSHK